MKKKKTFEKNHMKNPIGVCELQEHCALSSVYLVVRLGVDWSAPLCALQRLLHLLHLDSQMGFKVAAQRHAGVLGRLPAGENLVVTQQRPLVLGVQDFKCADLEKKIESVTLLIFLGGI